MVEVEGEGGCYLEPCFETAVRRVNGQFLLCIVYDIDVGGVFLIIRIWSTRCGVKCCRGCNGSHDEMFG